jgi:DNA-binding Lrp family transcriptional regulator
VISIATLAERAELSRRTVIERLADLEAAGLISRTRRNQERGYRAADEIRLAVQDLGLGAPDAPRDDEPKVQPSHLGENPRCNSRTSKVQLAHVLGAGAAPHIDKGLIEGLKKGSDPAFRKADIDALWEITPRVGRERSSRKDIERALSAAVRRGHTPADVLHGVKAYYASDAAMKDGGAYAKGCHRMIENDRWEAFAPPVQDEDRGVPAADPWRDRVQAFADPMNRHWPTDDRWGPAPGKPGCKAPLAILAEFGFGGADVIQFRKGDAA